MWVNTILNHIDIKTILLGSLHGKYMDYMIPETKMLSRTPYSLVLET